MKKKLALLLAAVMVVGMVPMTAFAASTNRISKIVTGAEDDDIMSTNAPVLSIYDDDISEMTTGNPNGKIAFQLDLTNAEWNYYGKTGAEAVASDGKVTEHYTDATGADQTRNPYFIEGLDSVQVTRLSAKSIVVEGYLNGKATIDDKKGIKVNMLTNLTDEGDASVTINPLQSEVTSGTYKFATVADGDATVTVESKKDVSENGATLKNIVIRETTANAFGSEGTIKLKLSSDWSFKSKTWSEMLSVYPSGLTGAFKAPATADFGDEDLEIAYDFDALAATGVDVESLRNGTPIIITIAADVVYDDNEVEPGEICEMTVSGDDISKTTLEVATAVTYGVTWEAEDKTLPVFYSGSMDEDNDTLEVTMEETVKASWLNDRKTKIVFPEGIRVLGVDISDEDNTEAPNVPFTINDDGNELTFNSWTKVDTDTASVTFQFQLSIAPDFTGDITATLTGKGVDEEIDAVIGTVVAPVTVEATKTDAIIDYRHTAIGDITITEAEAGVLEKGKKFALEIENLEFDDDPTVEVVSGDLKLKDVEVNDKGQLVMTVDSESAKEPAVIKVTNCELYMERNIPAGEYALKLVAVDTLAQGKVDTTVASWDGTSYAGNTDKVTNDTIFQNAITSGVDNDKSPYFDKRSVTVLDGYVNVVTSGRDQGDNTFTTTLKVTIGATEMYANDKTIALDVPAYISNGYTMLPVRAVTEALSDSAIVRWDDPTHTVTITFGDRVINMVVGSSTMVINGVEVPMQAQCEITDSRAFIPLRDMGYALGLNDSKINWDDATKTATLN